MSGSQSKRNQRREARTRAEALRILCTRFPEAGRESFCPLDTDLSWMRRSCHALPVRRINVAATKQFTRASPRGLILCLIKQECLPRSGVVGPCKTESSQKPVPIHPTSFGGAREMERRLPIHQIRRPSFREHTAPWSKANLGPGNFAEAYPPRRATRRDSETNSDGIHFDTRTPLNCEVSARSSE